MKWTGRFLLVLLALLIPFACKEEISVYRVGAIVPLTGSADAYGLAVKSGLTLALEQVNAEGGINGKIMDILFEDDRSDEKAAVDKTTEMIRNSQVPIIIGGVTSNVAIAMAPVCASKKVVLLSPTASSPKLSGVGQYFFRNYPSDTLEGRVMAEYAVRTMKIRSVAIIYIDNEYGQGLDNVFKQKFEALKGTITYDKGYPKGSTNFTAMIKEIKSSPPDAIYMPGYFDEVAGILKEIQTQKITAKLISSGGFASPRALEAAGDAAEGLIFPQPPYDPKSGNPMIQSFVAAYKKKFYSEPDVYAAYAYDALKITAKAISSCTKYPEDLRARLADISDFHGLTGTIGFDGNGDVDITPRIFQVKGGQFVPLK
jgi:branched-chain amino acid transport system substrate-binding protein